MSPVEAYSADHSSSQQSFRNNQNIRVMDNGDSSRPYDRNMLDRKGKLGTLKSWRVLLSGCWPVQL